MNLNVSSKITKYPKEIINKWQSEEVYQDFENILPKIIKDIDSSKIYVEMEMFIFSIDSVGELVLDALKRAAQRGVKVRLVVDGIGSPDFTPKILENLDLLKVKVRIYKPISWFFNKLSKLIFSFQIKKSMNLFSKMNRRNHRKTLIIDNYLAWVGSANISKDYQKWRETMIRVSGENVSLISEGFNWVWDCSSQSKKVFFKHHIYNQLVCNAFSWKNKIRVRKFRLNLINDAQEYIKIINPYFVPPFHFLIALLRAKKRGVEVSLLTTEMTDLFFVRWFSQSYYKILLKNGIKIYERKSTVLHSKVIITNSKAIIGTSNYNYRSINLDLEIDIIVNQKETLKTLNLQWDEDVSKSIQIISVPHSSLFNYVLKFISIIRQNS